ncbi:hypothetical protein NQ176_g11198 [Zarea fungicola]|uniref:Uncharacterized protein n=1 Tax=Zarea fungicola TaxID=93591 RepID=A0ACC1MDM3_9HYPO|nr:hypothetical protein NQ176_g11198 [Lecanicillium fungicola]
MATPVQLEAPNGVKWTQPTGLFINNQFVVAKSGETITTIDPATEKSIATVHAAGEKDIDNAVRAARAALKHPSWKRLPATDRGILMNRLADLLERTVKPLKATSSRPLA